MIWGWCSLYKNSPYDVSTRQTTHKYNTPNHKFQINKGMTVKLDMSEVNKNYIHQKSHRNLFPTDFVFNGRFPNPIFLNN